MSKSSLDQALEIYVGYNECSYPEESKERLEREFSKDEVDSLFLILEELLSDLNSVEIDWSKNDLVSASSEAVTKVLQKHPEFDAGSRAALEWVFSWWNR